MMGSHGLLLLAHKNFFLADFKRGLLNARKNEQSSSAAMAIEAKFLIFFVVALLALLMAESNSLVWTNEANDAADQYFPNKNAPLSATGDARRLNTRNHASSFATSAAASAYVCLQDIMATRGSVPATTTGRPRGVAQNAPNFIKILS
ncbi:hypothetical protein MA16_Dca012022 [Dendrobium catenatum]|uniref:Uncharacterized protein n=1 Tax=Dendrobium catenatum TaxID=906689 RepID=A0A2I0WDZ8_9ASPA|nr:hypothetical protein MA16_Dca012022 [Dendrobium catenatum]